MTTSLVESAIDQENSRKYLPFGEEIMKIGPVDTELGLLRVKKRKKKKLTQAKYIALLASLPSGLKWPYFHNSLTDFDEIWHGDAAWTTAGNRPLKLLIDIFKSMII